MPIKHRLDRLVATLTPSRTLRKVFLNLSEADAHALRYGTDGERVNACRRLGLDPADVDFERIAPFFGGDYYVPQYAQGPTTWIVMGDLRINL